MINHYENFAYNTRKFDAHKPGHVDFFKVWKSNKMGVELMFVYGDIHLSLTISKDGSSIHCFTEYQVQDEDFFTFHVVCMYGPEGELLPDDGIMLSAMGSTDDIWSVGTVTDITDEALDKMLMTRENLIEVIGRLDEMRTMLLENEDVITVLKGN